MYLCSVNHYTIIIMSYIKFGKDELINLENSLQHELIHTNKNGGWASSTVILCNTRKYHALLATPQPGIDDDNHVLLSCLDLEIIQNDEVFHCGVHRYKGGTYFPKGHKYIRGFEIDKYPTITYRVGGVVLKLELVFSVKDDRTILKYTLEEAHSPTTIRLSPFLAFRNVHALTHANPDADTSYEVVDNGIRMRLYKGYTPIYMQFSEPIKYIHNPHWNMDIEYTKELERGYEGTEDLLVPGYFEFPIKKGESVFFSAGVSEVNADKIIKRYNSEVASMEPDNTFEDNLNKAAQQFIIYKDGKHSVLAGLPFYGTNSRSTFVALYGLCLSKLNPDRFRSVLNGCLKELNGFQFPSNLGVKYPVYDNSDSALWFIYAIQKYQMANPQDNLWKEYGVYIKQIINGYLAGSDEYNINISVDGLLWAGATGLAMTWMNCVVDRKPVTPRTGFAVEVNALWYNSLIFAATEAEKNGEIEFAIKAKEVADRCGIAFIDKFWSDDKGYLADVSYGNSADWSVRPNQIIATAFEYTPLDDNQIDRITKKVKKTLLTPNGLRTLAPDDAKFKNSFTRSIEDREYSYHNGAIFPSLLIFFAESYLRLHGRGGVDYIKGIYKTFATTPTTHGIYSIPEFYESDPPYRASGSISQATSVSSILELKELIERYEL